MQRRVDFKNKFFTKAFPRVGAGERPHGVYTEGGEALAIAGASLFSDAPLGKYNAPLGCGDGLDVRFSFLELEIHHLASIGNRKALKQALYEYLKLSGVRC